MRVTHAYVAHAERWYKHLCWYCWCSQRQFAAGAAVVRLGPGPTQRLLSFAGGFSWGAPAGKMPRLSSGAFVLVVQTQQERTRTSRRKAVFETLRMADAGGDGEGCWLLPWH